MSSSSRRVSPIIFRCENRARVCTFWAGAICDGRVLCHGSHLLRTYARLDAVLSSATRARLGVARTAPGCPSSPLIRLLLRARAERRSGGVAPARAVVVAVVVF